MRQNNEPLLTALSHPPLEPSEAAVISQRPGELDPAAFDIVDHSPCYQQMADVPYEQSFMDQDGMNTTRRRHLDLLLHGLDAEKEAQ